MKIVDKILIVLGLMLAFLVGFYINYNLILPNVETITIVSEKQKCEQAGGEFYYDNASFHYNHDRIAQILKRNNKPVKDTITCTLPEKELWNIEVK